MMPLLSNIGEASISPRPDYADLGNLKPVPCNGIRDDVGIIQRSA
jgi:hypothetical protein